VESGNRKLIRPSIKESKERRLAPKSSPKRDPSAPEATNAENFYYVKQIQQKTPMVMVLKDGEEVQGFIEWYDKGCLKINGNDGRTLLIYKSNIKYMYKFE
jgi:sRNA-binding regulator protein Hfq